MPESDTSPSHIALHLNGGVIRAPLDQPSDHAAPVDLGEFWRRAGLPVSRAVAAAAEARVRPDRPITCRAGCGACCRQLATVSPAEAWALLDEFEATPEPRRAELAAAFDAAAARIDREGMLETLLALDAPALDDAAHYELARRYFALGLACPFLRDESCSIHPRRPAACGEYLVSSPADACARVFDAASAEQPDGERSAEPPIRRVHVSHEVGEAMIGLCAQLLGTGARRVPISLIPVWAERRSAERPRAWPWDKLTALFELHLDLAAAPADEDA